MKVQTEHPYKMILWKWILWTLLFYFFARCEFAIWNWKILGHATTTQVLQIFLQGFRFDLSAILTLSLPFYLTFLILDYLCYFKAIRSHKWWLVVAAALFATVQFSGLIVTLSDTEYVNFVGRRMTVDGFYAFREIPGKFFSFVQTYWILFLVNGLQLMIFVAGIFWWARWKPWSLQVKSVLPKYWYLKYPLWILGSLIFFVVGMRGGLQTKPLSFAHGRQFQHPMMNQMMLNSTFTMLTSARKPSLAKEIYFQNQEELLSLLNDRQVGPSLLKHPHSLGDHPNVILIIVESLALEYMGKVHGVKGYTPFLDELASKSLFFTSNFANGRRSIEGISSILGGIPALMNEPFVSSPFQTNTLLGLGTLLKAKNYHTSFFHGGQNGTMFFDQFAAAAGIDHYFGLQQYPDAKDFDGTWGIYDGPFLQFMIQKLNQFPQPFFSTVFTLSSHHPYKIPTQYQGKFPKGTAEVHESIGYADMALRDFFQQASKQPWFSKTLFVITADHTQKNTLPFFDNELGRYRVPLIFYAQDFQWPKVDVEQVTQHIDILPSVLDFVGVQPSQVNPLAASVFRPGDRVAVTMMDGRWMLVQKDYFLVQYKGAARSPSAPYGEMLMYRRQDPFEKSVVTDQDPILKNLQQRLQAVQQYFSQGMIDNRLYL